MGEIGRIVKDAGELTVPVRVPPEAYVSPEYAREEQAKLWRKVCGPTRLAISADCAASTTTR